tara:strand:- start:7970 stop:8908 length:939 start_codon:yes stop_codon:yes gene_type:complete
MVGIIDLLINAGSNLFSFDEDPVYVNRRGTGSGSPDDIYAGGTSSSEDTSSSESAFADLIGSDEDFANLYNALQDDPESVYSTINPIDISGSPFADLIMSDNDFADLFYDMAQNPDAGTTTVIPEGIEPETGILGGTLGPYLRETFLGSEDSPGLLEQILLGKVTGKDGSRSGGVTGILGGLLGGGQDQGFLGSPLVKLLLAKYLSKKDEGPAGLVPIGQQAFAAGGQGLGSMPDYRVFNIQPALMPGVAYANAPPPAMKHGGIHGAGKDDGPGDITLARLEPGEFVMTRKATNNIGARNLYKLMKQAERMG